MDATVCTTWNEYFDAGPGAIFKATDVTDPENPRFVWHTTPPCGHLGTLASPEHPAEDGGVHTVTEHEDGTITVDPSIWCQTGGDDSRQPCWHGHLKAGVWTSV